MANLPGQAKSSSSKRQEAFRKAYRSSGDRISNLPDDLICRILLFPLAKQAVATSILSKRWVLLWTLVPTLDLQDSNLCQYDERVKMIFVHFVHRVLLLKRSVSAEKLRLSLNCYLIYGYSCVKTWILSAWWNIRPKLLQEVDISFSEVAQEYPMKLPRGLFLMKTLKILKLHGGIMVDVPVSVCLPSLKILHLLHVNYANGESLHRLISGCPSLEELRINTTTGQENLVNINISTTTLKLRSDDAIPHRLDLKIEINAPALKHLNFSSSSFYSHQYFVERFPCLIEADFIVLDSSRITLLILLKGVKCLKFHENVSSTGVELELLSGRRWSVLSLFLQKSPKLETLVVHNKIFTNSTERALYGWTQPREVPKCFLSSLTRACFENFDDWEE